MNTKFDDWLSVQRCDHPTLSYMMNVRNGLLHSEYETIDEYGDLLEVNEDDILMSYKDKTRVKKISIKFENISKAHLAIKF
jgi:hypothetical protein